MSNFGFADLRLVNPYEVSFREAVSAVNADAVMQSARVFDSVAAAVADCSLIVGTTGGDHRETSQPLQRLELGGRVIRRHAGHVALLFGSEKHGLSNEDMSHCHSLVQIPSRPEHRSMNLGQAVAVSLYELIRSPRMARAPQLLKTAATAQQTQVLLQRVEEALRLSGYYDHTATAGSEMRLRDVIQRLNLSEQDAVIWMGMFRQILWKLHHIEGD